MPHDGGQEAGRTLSPPGKGTRRAEHVDVMRSRDASGSLQGETMRIEWTIAKKRGNLRPLLTYSVTLEDHEKALALPPLRVRSSIPEPEDSWQEYCYPGRLERAEGAMPASCYELEIPSHRGRSWPQTLRLPWRADNSYPEVEASFLALREAFEAMLAEACASEPMREQGALSSSASSRAFVAPAVLAERFLKMARGSGEKIIM